jgi:F-type H+-transporting ATPase subunit delta
MAYSSRVTSRYAKSVLGLAEELKVLESVKGDMAGIVTICEANGDLLHFLNSPIIAHETKEKILKTVFEGKVNDLTMKFITLLTKKGREGALYEIAKAFLAQYNIKKGIQKATVYTAVKIDAKLKASFEELVSTSMNKKVELEEEIREELIGGFVLRVDDQQIDSSIKTKLQQIRKVLN